MQKNLLRYIWKYSSRHQLVVVALTCLSFPILYMTLELPKWIINDALGGGSEARPLFGAMLEPVPFLVVLCVALLVLIIMNGVLKMRINTLKGIIGERLVRRLRFSLMQRLLRFPLSHFSRVSSGETISTVTAETEPLAGYIGESVALPLFQGGTMITILVFMFAQDWVFGLVSIALIPVQGYLIPKLQAQVNLLKKERVRHVRKLSERIGETVAGVEEIRLQGTEPYTLSEFSSRFGTLFKVRLEIFRKKFFMKFLNNTIGQVTPFLFYLFGGYLVIQGDLTIGALVAAIGAYKDLTAPWKELLNHYQAHEDAKIKYEQIIDMFDPDGLVDLNTVDTELTGQRLDGAVSLNKVSWQNENGERVLSGVSMDVPAGASVAITGDYAVRRNRLARILVGLDTPWSGSIQIDGKPMADIPLPQLRARVGFQGASPHVFSGTITDNVRYGLNRRPPDPEESGMTELDRDEAIASGNSEFGFDGSWNDAHSIGLDSFEEEIDWQAAINRAIGAEGIVYERSLLEVFDPKEKPELAAALLACRHRVDGHIVDEEMGHVIANFDPDVFNHNASIGENLLFGIPADDRLEASALSKSSFLREQLNAAGLLHRLVDTGVVVGTRILEMMGDLPTGSTILEHFGLEDDEHVDTLKSVLDRLSEGKRPKKQDENFLLDLVLRVVPEKHRFVDIDARFATQLLQLRRDFAQHLPDALQGAVIPFDRQTYHPRLTVKDNLLFGRVATDDPEASRRIATLLSDSIDEAGVRPDLMVLLGESQVGISGSRLPEVAKHRIPLGRVLTKRPDIIVLQDALGPMTDREQRVMRDNIRQLLPEATLIWIAREIDDENEFDQVYEFTEAGPLQQRGGVSAAHVDVPVVDGAAEPIAQRTRDPFSLISHATLFTPLTPSQQRYLSDHSRIVQVPDDRWIYEAGDEADAAWLVVSGEVLSFGNSPTEPIGRLTRLEVAGALDVLAQRPRLLSLRSKGETTLLRVDADAIEDIADGDAKVSRSLLRALTDQWAAGPSTASRRIKPAD